MERKVQKERETEGDMFNDKESFVTPAYRAKLAELKKLEEEERLKELREGKTCVKDTCVKMIWISSFKKKVVYTFLFYTYS